jgi:alkaline phosphatase
MPTPNIAKLTRAAVGGRCRFRLPCTDHQPGSIQHGILNRSDGGRHVGGTQERHRHDRRRGRFNALEATRQYLGDVRGGLPGELTVDGPDFIHAAQPVYALDPRNASVAGPAGLAQVAIDVYDPARNYDFPPVPGTTSAGFERGFAGYEWNRATAPDSANTMSAKMTGEKSYNNAINVDGNGTALLSLAEVVHQGGKATGVVSTVQISDATPAAGGGAHNVSRASHGEIATEVFHSGVLDVIAGTGNPDVNDNGQPATAANYDWIGQDLWNSLKAGRYKSQDGSG